MLHLALCHKELKETADAKTLLEKLAQQKLENMLEYFIGPGILMAMLIFHQ